MYTIKNNEGKKVTIDSALFAELRALYASGVWSTIIQVDKAIHAVVLPDNPILK